MFLDQVRWGGTYWTKPLVSCLLSSYLFYAQIEAGQTDSTPSFTWNGTKSTLMNDLGNWQEGAVPQLGIPLNLYFSQITPNMKPVNNIGDGTSPLVLQKFTLGNGYYLGGNRISFPDQGQIVFSGQQAILATDLEIAGTVMVQSVDLVQPSQIVGAITGDGGITVQTGPLVLRGTNLYRGKTSVSSGAKMVGYATNTFSPNSPISLTGSAVLDLEGKNDQGNSIATNQIICDVSEVAGGSRINLGGGALTIQTASGSNGRYFGIIESMQKGAAVANGGLAIAGDGTFTIGGNNTYSTLGNVGNTTVGVGATLVAGSGNAFGQYSNLQVDGTLNLSGQPGMKFGTLNGSGSINIDRSSLSCSAGGAFSGAISGAGGLTVEGGTLTLSGNPTYTGTTSIQGGTLAIARSLKTSVQFAGNGGTLSMRSSSLDPLVIGEISLQAPGVIDMGSNQVSITGIISGSTPLTIRGQSGGSLTLERMNTYTSNSFLQGGSVLTKSFSALGASQTVHMSNDAHLALAGDLNIGSLSGSATNFINLDRYQLMLSSGGVDDAFYGPISGSGSICVNGGTVTLMGEMKNHTGPVIIDKGATLNAMNLGSGSITFGSGGGHIEFGQNTTLNGDMTLNGMGLIGTNTYDVTLAGRVSGQTLSKLGRGTLTLTNVGPLSSILIRGGNLNFNLPSNGTWPTCPIVFDDFVGVLQCSNDAVLSNPITLSKPGTIDPKGHHVTLNAPITGGTFLTLNDSSTQPGILSLSQKNGYQGKTQIFNGTLQVVPGSIPSNTSGQMAQLVFGGTGIARLQTSGAFTGTNAFTGSVALFNHGLIDTYGNDMVLSGVIGGTPGWTLTKEGKGTLTLTGQNEYEGATIVQGGVLVAKGSKALGSSSGVTVQSGATLQIPVSNDTAVQVDNSGAIWVDGSSGLVTLSAVDYKSGKGSNLTISYPSNPTTTYVPIQATGALQLDGTLSLNTLPTGSNKVALLTGTSRIGEFTNVLFPALSKYKIEYSSLGAYLSVGSQSACHGIWKGTAASGNWGMASNWDSNCAPGWNSSEVLDAAVFPDVVGQKAVEIVFTDGTTQGSAVVNHVDLSSSATSYTLRSNDLARGLILDGDGQPAPNLSVTAGSHTIVAPITLRQNSTFQLSGGNLTIANGSDVQGQGLLITGGSGTLLNRGTITPTSFSMQGGSVINQGTISPVGNLFTLSGGTLQNSHVLGSADNDFAFTGGTLHLDQNSMLANNYQQGSQAHLQITLPSTFAGYVPLTTANALNLNGKLTVDGLPNQPTNVVLFQSNNWQPKNLQGTFSTVTLSSPLYQIRYDTVNNQVFLFGGSESACHGVWSGSSANWEANGSWSSGCVPGWGKAAIDLDSASFPNLPTATAVTVTVPPKDTARQLVLNQIEFSGTTTSYTLAPSSSTSSVITLDGDGIVKPHLIVSAGKHTIFADLQLNKPSIMQLSGTLTHQGTIRSPTVHDINTYLLSIMEGSSARGVLHNLGSIMPENVTICGAEVINEKSIAPSMRLFLAPMAGNVGITSLTNLEQGEISATEIILDTYGATAALSNTGGKISFSSACSINGDVTLRNSAQGQILGAASGACFRVKGGSVVNEAGSTIDLATFPGQEGSFAFDIVGGSVINGGSILTKGYFQRGGEMTVAGKISTDTYHQTDGVLTIEVASATQAPVIEVAQEAELGGHLTVHAADGFMAGPGSQIPLMVAQKISSQFAQVDFTNFSSSMIPSLRYLPDQVQLYLQSGHDHPPHARAETIFSSIAQHNTFFTRKCFQLSRRGYLNMEHNGSKQSPSKGTILPSPTGRWFVGPVINVGRIESRETQLGWKFHSVGAIGGFDTTLGDAASDVCGGVGIAVDYRHTQGIGSFSSGKARMDHIHASGYGVLSPACAPAFMLEVVAGVGRSWDQLSRITGMNYELETKGSTHETIGDILGGCEWSIPVTSSIWITPGVHLQYVANRMGSFAEKGAGIYDVWVHGKTLHSCSSAIGSRFDAIWHGEQQTFQLGILGQWVREYQLHRDREHSFTAFHVTGEAGNVTMNGIDRDSGLLELHLATTTQSGWGVEGNLAFQKSAHFYNCSLFVGVGKAF